MPAYLLFLKVGTQWRSGPNGVLGLDHNVVMRHLDRMNLDAEAWDRMLDDVTIMELEALEIIRSESDN